MNQFGGNWTIAKIEMLVEYARAYLVIMNRYPRYKLMYFDGFAGTGFIEKGKGIEVKQTVGAARRIVELEQQNADRAPRVFDMYYFVEKATQNVALLKEHTKDVFPQKDIHVAQGDCNEKMIALAEFLKKPGNENWRTLAYIDPYGMQLSWNSIAALKGLGVDMWVLVPTGMGVSRLLKNNGQIDDTWLTRLELFLGMDRKDILAYFYKEKETLFPDLVIVSKEDKVIQRSAELYQKRLKEVFSFVSKGYEMRNSNNVIMYHFFLASNNNAGHTIANDIVKKYNSQ